jgi:hypothetical protein
MALRSRFRLSYTQLTPFEQSLLHNAFKKRLNIGMRNQCRHALVSNIRKRLAREYPVMNYALMWAYQGYVDVYIPTEKLRQHSMVS